jgi:nicotinate-nucleotide adenylyltransferase
LRVGLFGGSFNPIHFGHLRAAEEVREMLKLDLVYFVPASSPPHKPEGELAPAEHRLQMVRLAFMVSDAEIRRAGRSYTIDTARHFTATLRHQAQIFILMGSDQFLELETWKDCDELVKLCSIAVHTRLRDGEAAAKVSLAALNRFGYSKEQDHYVNPGGQTLSFVQTTFFPISATQIRLKIQNNESINYLLPGDVVDYLRRHALY